jgi:hypothetical protein
MLLKAEILHEFRWLMKMALGKGRVLAFLVEQAVS